MLNSVSIASKHAICFEGAAPDFFEGALMGNGGLGLVVTTRPDAICLHIGHNNVWDIRVREKNIEKLGTFEEIFQKVNSISDDLKTLFEDSWYAEYHRITEENYLSVKYPRPFPCGTVMLFFDMRKAEITRHRLDISKGLLSIEFLTAEGVFYTEVLVEPVRDRIWLSTFDSDNKPAGSMFNKVRIIPEEDSETKIPGFNIVESGDDSLCFVQCLPSQVPEDKVENEFHPKDKGFSMKLSCNQKLVPVKAMLESALSPVEKLTLVISIKEGLYKKALDIDNNILDINYDNIRNTTIRAWEQYWEKSAVSLEDEFLEQIWYRNLYFFNCATRPESTCPGLFANWMYKNIGTAWHGDYHMNYNTQQPFWVAFSSNHADKHVTYISMVEKILPLSRKWAKEYYGMSGACIPHSLYPVEMNLVPYPVPDWGWEICETPWTVQSLWWHYVYTKDTGILQRIYNPIKEAVLFLIDYMSRSDAHGQHWGDNKYHVFPTVVPELYGLTPGFKMNADCIVDLTLIRFVFKAFIEACRIPGTNEDENEKELAEKCRNILENMPEYPVEQTAHGPVFVNVKSEDPEIVQNTPNTVIPVFPGEDIGMDSPKEVYETAVRTWRRHRNEGGNNLVFYNLQGARLGILDIEKFKRHVKYCMHPNGTCGNRVEMSGGRYADNLDFDYMMHMGIWFENLALPTVINDCLIHGYSDTIRLFPNWSLDKRASFRDIRTAGAFLISASCEKGSVLEVEVFSEKGGTFKMHNPWKGNLLFNGRTLSGTVLEFKTVPGEKLLFLPE